MGVDLLANFQREVGERAETWGHCCLFIVWTRDWLDSSSDQRELLIILIQNESNRDSAKGSR